MRGNSWENERGGAQVGRAVLGWLMAFMLGGAAVVALKLSPDALTLLVGAIVGAGILAVPVTIGAVLAIKAAMRSRDAEVMPTRMQASQQPAVVVVNPGYPGPQGMGYPQSQPALGYEPRSAWDMPVERQYTVIGEE